MRVLRNCTWAVLEYKYWYYISGKRRIDWARFNVPPNTLQVILGRGFYGPNDPTYSVKAL